MPPARQAKKIPKLPSADLDKAEHCVRLIWVGQSYLKDNKMQTQDERFLEQLSKPVEDFLTNHSSAIMFDQKHIHDLMVVGGLKALFRSKAQLDFIQFQQFLEAELPCLLPNSAQLTANEISDFLKAAGKALVNKNVQTNAGYRVALASRILFFALPTMQLFNFSNDLAEALVLPTRPQVAIYKFQEIFENGLTVNKSKLSSYPIPKSRGLVNSNIYKVNLVLGDWWQRRIFDLAVRINLRTVDPLNPLPPRP
tara:strand:- start:284 stop:1042 length:759 start_codon:yes stop_codon:yes gene_type:complete